MDRKTRTGVIYFYEMKKDMVELTVAGISLDRNADNPQVILRSRDRDFTLALSIGPFEAGAIIMEMEKVKPAAPLLTHDSFAGFFTRHGFRVDCLLLHTVVHDTCLARMIYHKGFRKYDTEIRPSDGIALAVRLGAPVYISSGEKAKYETWRMPTERDVPGEEREFLFLGDGGWPGSCLH